MNATKLIFIPLLAAALLATLSGCGGGGPPSQSVTLQAFDSTEFQGVWKRNDGTASDNRANCFSVTEYGGSYGGRNRPIVIADTTLTQPIELYSDTTCTSYSGLLVKNFSVTWTAGSVAGRTNVARALVTSTGYTMAADGGTGFSLANPPASGVVSKVLEDVVGQLLYFGAATSPADADGYPTSLPTTAIYTR